MSDWQPIETAPKDGRRIIAFVPDSGPYDPRVMAYWNTREWGGHGWLAVDEQCGGETEVDPTHWLPLAEAPHV